MAYRNPSSYYPGSPYRESRYRLEDPLDRLDETARSIIEQRKRLKSEIEDLLRKKNSRTRPRDYSYSDMGYSGHLYSGGYADDLRELEEEDESKPKKKKKLSKGPPKEFFCRDCQVTCSSRQTMETHLRGRQHLNAIKEVFDDETYCKVCRISYHGPFDLHVKSKQHRRCARTCNVCCQVFEIDGEFQEHIKKHKIDEAAQDEGDLITVPIHDNPQSEPGEEPILLEMVEDITGYVCKTCEVFFRGDEKAKLEHCATKKHLEKFSTKDASKATDDPIADVKAKEATVATDKSSNDVGDTDEPMNDVKTQDATKSTDEPMNDVETQDATKSTDEPMNDVETQDATKATDEPMNGVEVQDAAKKDTDKPVSEAKVQDAAKKDTDKPVSEAKVQDAAKKDTDKPVSESKE